MESPKDYYLNPPVHIPNIIIKKNKINNKDLLGTKYEYDKIGSNGLLEIKPKLLKFTGFEVHKCNIQKVFCVNSSSISQRIHVLPPMSPYFQIKFDKKGNLAPGISEEIQVIFKPTEYKYYFDTIRIHTETDKFQIPIHAYPIMNRENVRDVFPRLIDFGYVEIGEQEKRVFPLICKIPLNFEFEFTFIKEHPDVYVHPNRGIVPGKGAIDIEISYTPSVNVTIDVELELKISQFDFEPLVIKIKGTGKNKIEKPQKSNKLLEPIKKLASKTQNFEKTNEKLEGKIDENFKKNELKSLMKPAKLGKTMTKRSKSLKEDEMKKIKTLTGRQILEKEFFDRSNQVFKLCKDRDIKFFTCLGDPWISEENRSNILQKRKNYQNDILKNMEYNGVHRYFIQIDQDMPIAEEIKPNYASTWDLYKNNFLEKRSQLIHKFVIGGTSTIIKSRMLKRLAKIKEFLGEAKTKEEVKRKVAIDWLKYEYAGIGKKDHIAFRFEISANNFEKINFPYQYENSNTFPDFNFQVNPKMSFDDLGHYEELPRSDFEEFYYKSQVLSTTFLQPTVENRENRVGAEEEYLINGPVGAFEKISDEIKDNPLIVMNKMPELNLEKYITVHESLRTYKRFENITEIDPEYQLMPMKLNFQDSLDPYPNDDIYVLNYEFLSKTPGLIAIHATNFLNVENNHYIKAKLAKEYEYGVSKEKERQDVTLMKNEEEEDHFTDSDSDGDGPPDVLVEDLNDFLKKIEADDKAIKEIREKNEKEPFDEFFIKKAEIAKNFGNEKVKWGAIMPSKTADYNKFIERKELKILIQ